MSEPALKSCLRVPARAARGGQGSVNPSHRPAAARQERQAPMLAAAAAVAASHPPAAPAPPLAAALLRLFLLELPLNLLLPPYQPPLQLLKLLGCLSHLAFLFCCDVCRRRRGSPRPPCTWQLRLVRVVQGGRTRAINGGCGGCFAAAPLVTGIRGAAKRGATPAARCPAAMRTAMSARHGGSGSQLDSGAAG